MSHMFIPDLAQEISIPEKGILSTVLRKDDFVNITLFAFANGEELTAHSAPTPATLYFLEGEAIVQLGSETVQARQGSFTYMPPMLPHSIAAKTATKMLLVQIKMQTK
ncbi:MAG: cupin domain-containing protein [Acidobacteriota bacterium]|nr:cupin domain-containing protein [Acidobacteriota bacterium]